MSKQASTSVLMNLSMELAGVVEQVGPSVVRVDDGSRLTATGLIWSSDGLIVTTSHGVERDDNVVVELGDGTRHNATVAGRDPDTDLAALRVSAAGLAAVQPADQGEVQVGHLALALGRPGDAGLQATIGIISTRHDTERDGVLGYIVHTDAVLYPGFSGGALVNVGGRVIGLTNLMFGRGKGVAVGAPVVEQITQTLLAHGTVSRGYLGIRTQVVRLPEGQRQTLSLTQQYGLLLLQVESGSPAEQGGMLLGDTILAIDGRATEDPELLRRHLRSLRPGQPVTLQIVRGGARLDLTLAAGTAPGA
jgi:S1-C subfamily serine protease